MAEQRWRSGVRDCVAVGTAGGTCGDPAFASVPSNVEFVKRSKPAAASPAGTSACRTERAVPVATGLLTFEGEHDRDKALDVPLTFAETLGVLLPVAGGVLLPVAGDPCRFLAQLLA